jgi:ABC-type branched-subunit amino acid transport system substrate-binding protein
VNYAVSQINAAGGIRGVPVKITSYDDANNTSQAVLVVAQAVPGSLLLLGPNSITTMTAMESTIMNAKILDVGASREPSVRSQLAPYGIDSDPDLVANGIIGAKAWLALNPSIKRVGLLYYPAFPYPFGTQVPAALASLGVTVDLLPLSWGQTDFTPQATKGIANGDQGYIDESYPNGHITFAEALFNRGITQGTELFGGAPVDDPTLFTVGKGYLENSYLCQTSNPLNTSAAFTNMMAAYKASHNGSLPSLSTLGFYNAMYAIKATFETLGITGNPSLLNAERAEIASYLYNSPTFQGVQGSFQYTNGQNIASMYMLQIKNNQYTAVSTLPPQ